MTHSGSWVLVVLPGFFFPTGGTEVQGRPLCAGLGEGRCKQFVVTSLTLPVQSVLISLVQGGA